MLGDEYPGAGNLAADGRPLQHAQDEQQERRPDADLRISRQQANRERRQRTR
jgi:hypothetical protein